MYRGNQIHFKFFHLAENFSSLSVGNERESVTVCLVDGGGVIYSDRRKEGSVISFTLLVKTF